MSTDHKELKDHFFLWIKALQLNCAGDRLSKNFDPLFQNANLRKLWKFLINYVKDQETASKIKKAVDLQTIKEENFKTQQSCSKISNELKKLNAEIQKLEKRVKLKRSKCSKSDAAASYLQKSNDSNVLKSIFHEQHDASISSAAKELQAQSEKLTSTCPQIHLHHDDTIASEKQSFFSCCSELKKLLSSISELYEKGFKADLVDKGNKTDVWKTLVQTLSTYSPKIIAKALTTITKENTAQLEENVVHDDENKLPEESKASPIETVQTMMQSHHAESLQEQLEARKRELMTEANTKECEALVKQLHENLLFNPFESNLWEVIGTEMRLKGEEAFFRSLQSSVHDLNEQLENSAKFQRELERMQQEVSNFHKDLARNKVEIVETTRQNSDFQQKITSYQTETLQIAESSVCQHQEEFTRLSTELRRCLKEEYSSTTDCDLSNLQTVEIDSKKEKIQSLSIYRPLNEGYDFGNQAYQDALSTLGINIHTSPSESLNEVVKILLKNQLQQEVEELRKNRKLEEKKLVEKVEEIHVQADKTLLQHATLMANLTSQAEKSADVLKEGEQKLQDALEHWLNQPAQHEAPWLKVNGKDLKKWKEQKLILSQNL